MTVCRIITYLINLSSSSSIFKQAKHPCCELTLTTRLIAYKYATETVHLKYANYDCTVCVVPPGPFLNLNAVNHDDTHLAGRFHAVESRTWRVKARTQTPRTSAATGGHGFVPFWMKFISETLQVLYTDITSMRICRLLQQHSQVEPRNIAGDRWLECWWFWHFLCHWDHDDADDDSTNWVRVTHGGRTLNAAGCKNRKRTSDAIIQFCGLATERQVWPSEKVRMSLPSLAEKKRCLIFVDQLPWQQS